jgi:hypothetical protein
MGAMKAIESQRYWSEGCLHLPGLFPRDMLAMFYQQMRNDLVEAHGSLSKFTARGPLISKDAIEVYSMQYAPMRAFLWGVTPMIAATVEQTLLPTYAYLRIYQQGDVCRVHTDRQACEHSLSLTIAYGENRPWALSVGTDRIDEPKPVAVDDFEGAPFISIPMAAGDGVLYQGVHHRHGRIEPNPNSWSAHLFMHWIDASGRYCDEAFDRPTLERARSQHTG